MRTEDNLTVDLLEHRESCMTVRDTLGDEVETESGVYRGSFESISADELKMSPVLTEESLLMFTSGPFQLRTAFS